MSETQEGPVVQPSAPIHDVAPPPVEVPTYPHDIGPAVAEYVVVTPTGPLTRYVVVSNATGRQVNLVEWEHGPDKWAEYGYTDTHLVPEAGWVPPPVPLSEIAPEEVTNAQIRVALSRMPGSVAGRSLLDDVSAWVASENGAASIGWEYANTMRRDGEWVQAAKAKLGWSEDQLAELFIAAGSITL